MKPALGRNSTGNMGRGGESRRILVRNDNVQFSRKYIAQDIVVKEQAAADTKVRLCCSPAFSADAPALVFYAL